jgi:hypothetical protein
MTGPCLVYIVTPMSQCNGKDRYVMMPTYKYDADSKGDDFAKSRHIVERFSVNGITLVSPAGRFGR